MLTQPQGPMSQHGCVSGARAVLCTAVLSNLILSTGECDVPVRLVHLSV
ncbi:hypothetical protein IEO21_08279 [Rhodonia placenta]|uniref:Uncharacterized protein n=1 Tax=Rhodonia placenta TaxID=104341 RepID=A0A8H7NWI0_9APHY|nr:hypothetical protein IEO21_08279 [Postia placenta]